jgi:hypothetical protein
MSGIHIIQGKPVLGANVIATLVKNDRRYNYQVKRCDNTACELVWFEDGKPAGSSGFTIEEAKAAGLTGKDNWAKYPSDMLFARAISRGARRFAPGIFGGSPVYTPDEMGVETDHEGYIDSVAVEVTDQPVPAEPPAPAATTTEPENSLEPEYIPEPKPARKTNAANTGFNPVAALIEWGYAESNFDASGMLNKSPYTKGKMTAEELKVWAGYYRGWRDMGATSDQAAEKATAGQKP